MMLSTDNFGNRSDNDSFTVNPLTATTGSSNMDSSSRSSWSSSMEDLSAMIDEARASTSFAKENRERFREKLLLEIGEERERVAGEEAKLQRTAKHWLGSIIAEGDRASLKDVQEKIQGIANDSLELHNSVMKTKEHLQSIASCAESVFNTDLKEVFEEKMSCTPWNGPDSTLAVVLSDLFQAVRDLENGADGGGKWEAPSSFTRETIKHFVEPNKLSELLYTCCQEVPLLVYGKEGCLTSDLELDALEKDKLWASLATKISSIYFDSLDGTLYHDRIRRSEGAQLFRVRWYGEKPSGDEKLFLELKTHHEPWTQASSVKERVNLCEKHMSLFLDHKPWTYVEALPIVIEANPKLNGSDLDQAVDLLLQMHQLVIDKNLRPRVRSVYQRVAFQSSTSNALRLTVDRDVKMIDETAAPLGAWCLPDSVPTDEKLVPYPIFEVKLAGSDMPASIDALNENGTLIQAAKFSKFLTGFCAFNRTCVRTLPYWAEYTAFCDMLMPDNVKEKQSINANALPGRRIAKRKDSLSSKTVSTSKPSTLKPSKSRLFDRPFMSLARNKEPSLAPKKAVRVEPKSYFANERTFIQWASAALWLLTAAALLRERELPDGRITYLTQTGVALCFGAIMLLIHSIYTYFKRIRLMRTGNPNGYADFYGPILLFSVVFTGVGILLFEQSSYSFGPTIEKKTTNILHVSSGKCFLHSHHGISSLTYQPSGVIFDEQSGLLLTVSLGKIIGHSISDLNATVWDVIDIPGADLEDLAMAEGRYFALSEPDPAMVNSENALIYELAWNGTKMEVVQKFTLGATGDGSAEGITYIPASSGKEKGSLCVDRGFGLVELFDLPEKPTSSETETGEETYLVRSGGYNKRIIAENLSDGKIGSLYHFEGILYVLFDNDKVLRSFDIASGDLISEMTLPKVSGAVQQWEGFAIHRQNNFFPPLDGDQTYLRQSKNVFSSKAIVHLTLDTPSQLWSFSVEERAPGDLVFPDCAARKK